MFPHSSSRPDSRPAPTSGERSATAWCGLGAGGQDAPAPANNSPQSLLGPGMLCPGDRLAGNTERPPARRWRQIADHRFCDRADIGRIAPRCSPGRYAARFGIGRERVGDHHEIGTLRPAAAGSSVVSSESSSRRTAPGYRTRRAQATIVVAGLVAAGTVQRTGARSARAITPPGRNHVGLRASCRRPCGSGGASKPAAARSMCLWISRFRAGRRRNFLQGDLCRPRGNGFKFCARN